VAQLVLAVARRDQEADLVAVPFPSFRGQGWLRHALAGLLLRPVATRWNGNVVAATDLGESDIRETVLPVSFWIGSVQTRSYKSVREISISMPRIVAEGCH